MAPLSQEPDAIRVVLDVSQRRAFYHLVSEITAFMRAQLNLRRVNPPTPSSAASRDGVASSAPSAHSHALLRVRKAALMHFDAWRLDVLRKLKDVVAKADDQKILDARRKRAAEAGSAAASANVAKQNEDLLLFDDAEPVSQTDHEGERELQEFQRLWHPIPTRLATIPLRDRQEVLSAMILLLLSAGSYSAYSRVLVCHIVSALGVPPATMDAEEKAIAVTMIDTAQKADAEAKAKGGMSAEAEAQKRRDEGRAGRLWKVGLASVAGAAIVGVTGGLAAPVVAAAVGGLMGSVGLGGLAGFLGIFWMNGALVGTLFGAFGAKMTGEIVDTYAKEVEDFKFIPLGAEWGKQWTRASASGNQPGARRLRVTIGINGWLESEDDVSKPWRVVGDESEVFALQYEMSSLMSLGQKLRDLVGSAAWNFIRLEILRRTVLVTLQTALWPVLLLNSASSIDNPFSLAKNRSEKAGQILADALINKVQGERPVTLIGYSLGARVIYSCLRVLAERQAFGLVDTVVLIGAPVPSNIGHWQMMRSVVAGKLFNVHSKNDFILGFLYRSTSLQLGIAGLQDVGAGIEGVEDIDLSEEVQGHLRYPGLIAQILHRCGFRNVQNGNAVIEKEKNSPDGGIQLRNNGYAELGNLIDFDGKPDEKPGPLLPSRSNTLSEIASLEFGDSSKQKDIVTSLNISPMATGNNPASPESTETPTAASRAAPDSHDMFGFESQVSPNIGREQAVGNAPHATPEASRVTPQLDEDEDDEYYEAPISMLNYDDDSGSLTMLEPMSISDDTFQRGNRH